MRSFAVGRVLRGAIAPAIRPRSSFSQIPVRSFALPTVADRVVHVTFINKGGERKRIAAMDGQTLYEAAVKNNVLVGDLFTCHVVLTPDSFEAHEPPLREEVEYLNTFADRAPTSRMASFLKLTADVKETIVALNDVRDFETP